jgi:hypothetical protein
MKGIRNQHKIGLCLLYKRVIIHDAQPYVPRDCLELYVGVEDVMFSAMRHMQRQDKHSLRILMFLKNL